MVEQPIQWTKNRFKTILKSDPAIQEILPSELPRKWASDRSLEGYEAIPEWVMQGYTTRLSEAQEQLAAQGLSEPTPIVWEILKGRADYFAISRILLLSWGCASMVSHSAETRQSSRVSPVL